MRHYHMRLILVCAILVSTLGATALSTYAQGFRIAQFVEALCPMPLPEGFAEGEDIVCGYVTVPEDHEAPEGKSLQLAVAILRSTGTDPASDPLLMLQGGPGTSVLSTFVHLMALPFGESFLAKRDVVLLEQRGAYYAKPTLFCPAGETSAACRARLIAEGVDLQAYNIANNAADVATVMDALGYPQYNLYGVSFGTILAQYVMRDYPDHLRSVILDSVLPITLDESAYGGYHAFSTQSRLLALHQFYADCAADPVCDKYHPDLEGEYEDLIVYLNDEPAILSFEDPETGEPFEVALTGDRLLGMLIQALYGGLGHQIPILMDLVAAGEYGLVFSPEMFMEGGESTWSAGMHYVMNCSALPELTRADLDAQGLDALVVQSQSKVAEGFNALCAEWGIEQPDYSAVPPAVSDIPTLLLSGMLDPNTPPRNAEIVAEHLGNGVTVAFPGLGHEVIHRHSCPRSIALDFLDDPIRLPDTACAGEMRSRLVSEPLAARLLAVQKDPPILRLALLLGSLLLLLSGVAAWSIAALRGHRGGQDRREQWARLTAGTAAALNILFVVLFVASNPMEVVYGYPLILRLAMLLPLISIVPAAGALIYAALAWKQSFWGLGGRIHYTLVSLAIVVFVGQLDYWHLLGRRL